MSKALVIRLSTFLDYGGIETKMANLSRISSPDFEFIFVAIGRGGACEEKIRKNGREVICLNAGYRIPSFRTVTKLARLFHRFKPDVVHCSGAEAIFHGVLAAKVANTRVVISEEIGLSNRSFISRVIFSFLFRLSNFVLGESCEVCDHINSQYWVSETKLRVVPNFIDRGEHKSLSVRSTNERLRVLSVCRLESIKNISGVLTALSKLKEKGYSFEYLIIGDGAEFSELKTLTSALGLNENVEFLGFLADPDPYYQSADLFLSNSDSEGFSNSLLEAMYFNLPVITTEVGGASQLITDGVNGWLIRPREQGELIEKLKDVFNMSRPDRLAVGERGGEIVRSKYSGAAHLDGLLNIYKHTL